MITVQTRRSSKMAASGKRAEAFWKKKKEKKRTKHKNQANCCVQSIEATPHESRLFLSHRSTFPLHHPPLPAKASPSVANSDLVCIKRYLQLKIRKSRLPPGKDNGIFRGKCRFKTPLFRVLLIRLRVFFYVVLVNWILLAFWCCFSAVF